MWTPPHIRATRARDNVEPDPRHLSPVQSLRWAYHMRREMSVAAFILAATAAVEPAVISKAFTTHLSRK